ncbi:hypothetical protein [Cerasicoccus fimbriatus]|uniref:hypothetical protein n=1 Tax=Cerasicoccus fimbriatus TaxID=3014554 RepID=UPI0022B49AE7|nr:hypothetical protein [Cerasicoccus sp. TK19100]
MKLFLRKLIRNSPFAFSLYLSIVRPPVRGRMPDRSTQLHLTGFPRSANTLAMRMLHEFFPALAISTHIHTIASLKLALKYNIPTVVLVRDPVSTITSLVVMRANGDASYVSTFIRDYVDYNEYVESHLDSFTIFSFYELVSEPKKLVRLVAETVRLDFDETNFDRRMAKVYKVMDIAEDNREAHVSQLPNADKERLKKEYVKLVESHPLFERAQRVYSVLMEEVDSSSNN